MKLEIQIDTWEMHEPFVTARDTTTHIDTVTAVLADGDLAGRGEALGIGYLGESRDSIVEQIEGMRDELEAGADRAALQALLPPGGARNALDCAMWDLEAKRSASRVWDLLDMSVQPVETVFTISLNARERMAAQASRNTQYPVLKLKLDGEDTAGRLRAVRKARPDARLVVDGNCSWSMALLDELADTLVECAVEMLEQPLPAGGDDALTGYHYPVPLCADESCQDSADLETAATRYSMINIKLDKSGGLTEALAMIDWCKRNGLELMVGNMLGSSLAMAPGFLVAQACRFVDLDGPLWQRTDRDHPIEYRGSLLQAPPQQLWG